MTPRSSVCVAFPESLGLIPNTYSSQPAIAPVPEHLTLSYGLRRSQKDKWYTDVHADKKLYT